MTAPEGAKKRGWLPRYLPLLLVVGGVAAIIRLFVAENNDMAPGVREGDLVLLIPRPVWLFHDLRRGDLVLLPPHDARSTQLRRIVGLPGEVVEIAGGKLLVESTPLGGATTGQLEYKVGRQKQRYRTRVESFDRDGLRYEVMEQEAWHMNDRPGVKIAAGERYLLADRRSGARDSRDYGPVKAEELRRYFTYVLIPGYSLLWKGIGN